MESSVAMEQGGGVSSSVGIVLSCVGLFLFLYVQYMYNNLEIIAHV